MASFMDTGFNWDNILGGGSVNTQGFMDPSMSWSNLAPSNDYGLGSYSFDNISGMLNDAGLGQTNWSDSYFGPMYNFGQPSYDLGLTNYTPTQDSSIWSNIMGGLSGAASGVGGALSKVGSWLGGSNPAGTGSNLSDLVKLTMGGLGLYGNWRDAEENRALLEKRLALERELGSGKLGLEQNQFGLGALDDMASKAMGMQLLINRGRMTADQVNPWLNEMYTGRRQMFGDNPELSQAYANNPYGSAPLGAAASMPTSVNQFFTGLDPLRKAEGGLASMDEYLGGGRYFDGGTGGQDDLIDAKVSDGEYVFDADTVAALGDGNNRAGAEKLDQMREEIRRHKRSAPASKIPPKAKNPLDYLGE